MTSFAFVLDCDGWVEIDKANSLIVTYLIAGAACDVAHGALNGTSGLVDVGLECRGVVVRHCGWSLSSLDRYWVR